MSNSSTAARLPRLSSLVGDELIQNVLGYFTERLGVRAWFQDRSGYTIAPETHVPAFCTLLSNHHRCGLANPAVKMPADPSISSFRTCMGGIGHSIIPVTIAGAGGELVELGRLITEPLALRSNTFDETFDEARRLHLHPDNLAAAAREIPVVDPAELDRLVGLVGLVVARVARENTDQARSLAVAEAFQEVGHRGSHEAVHQLLARLVQDFTGADATFIVAGTSLDAATRHEVFSEAISTEMRTLVTSFTGEAIRWVAQTGYPISFPDLGGSAWCRHVLAGRDLEGALVAIPVRLPQPGEVWWWATYFRHPARDLEDQLHRLSVMAAHGIQTVDFLSRLEASQEAAITDPLTGLYNRRLLREQLERELGRSVRGRYPVSLVVIDIDNFKAINDTHGHVAGDEALKQVAAVLREPLRASSIICRYGGDEFCVVVPECDRDDARLVAERLVERIIATPVKIDGATFQMSASGGTATRHPDEPPGTDLFELADRQLLAAKRAGKGRVHVG
ncbi:MAG: GGDEF domain-containing protein [Candidatus Dormibacteria bacterium]